MVDESNVFPEIVLDQETIDRVRANLGLDDGPKEDAPQTFAPPKKRRRGRPRKYPISQTGTTVPGLTDDILEAEGVKTTPTEFLPPAKLGKREEREVAERLAKMLTGATGVASMAKPYLQMTEEEAKDISEPLASYLVRNAETIPIAGQVLENYDLAAILFATMAYVVRVYNDRRTEVAITSPKRPSSRQPETTFMDSVTAAQNGNNGREQSQGDDVKVSSPYDSGNGV